MSMKASDWHNAETETPEELENGFSDWLLIAFISPKGDGTVQYSTGKYSYKMKDYVLRGNEKFTDIIQFAYIN